MTTADTMTTLDYYRAAAADLDTQGIFVVIADGRAHDELTPDDAWCKYAHPHGGRAGVAFAEDAQWAGGELHNRHGAVPSLYFSHPHTDTTVAAAIAETFLAHGFDVEWNGDPADCVRVHL